MKLRPQIYLTIALLAVLVAVFFVRGLILGGPAINLSTSSSQLAGFVAPSLVTNQKDHKLPQPGKDFRVTSTDFFDNGNWAVVGVESLPDKNGATVVLKRVNKVYTVVLGPGTSFSKGDVLAAPQDVISFLRSESLVGN